MKIFTLGFHTKWRAPCHGNHQTMLSLKPSLTRPCVFHFFNPIFCAWHCWRMLPSLPLHCISTQQSHVQHPKLILSSPKKSLQLAPDSLDGGNSFFPMMVTNTLFSSVQFISVAQLCPTLCDPMNRSTPGLPVHHQLPEFTQTHVHWVGDAIQPFHPLSSPSPPSIRIFSNESTFRMRWPKYWSFSLSISPSNERPGLISFRMYGLISFQSKGLARVFSSTTVQKHQFFSIQLS